MRSRKPSVGILLARPDRTFHLAKRLRERGFEVTHYNTQAVEGDPVVRIRGDFASVLVRLLLGARHDVYFASLFFVAPLALYVNRLLRGKPYVFNLTGLKWHMFRDQARERPFPSLFERRIYPFLLERTFAGASRIVCNSRFLERAAAARYPQYRERLTTIYNGIDFDHYGSGRRQALPGVAAGEVILVCVTAVNFEGKTRGLELVLDAVSRLRARRAAVKLVIAAKAASPRSREYVEGLVRSKSAGDSVILQVNHPNVPDLLASGDVFVYAAPDDSNDSLPRALLEAQSAGLPAVTTDTVGCPEIVQDGETGFVVPYDADAIAERVMELVASPERRRELSRRARERVRERFDWERMADRYAELFEAVAS